MRAQCASPRACVRAVRAAFGRARGFSAFCVRRRAGKFGRSRITRRSFIFGQIPEWAASGALTAATIPSTPPRHSFFNARRRLNYAWETNSETLCTTGLLKFLYLCVYWPLLWPFEKKYARSQCVNFFRNNYPHQSTTQFFEHGYKMPLSHFH